MSTRASRIHVDTAREAGYGRLSVLSVIAGVVSAYGAFAIIAAIAGAVLTSIDVDTEFRTNDWTGSGAVAALATAVVLFLAYVFGGYVAGRMARRSGVLHGVLVFVVSLVIGGVVGGLVQALTDNADIEQNLRSVGVPTSWDQVSDVAVAAVVVSVLAVLVGSVVGGMLGEAWHTKLARRAADPEIGPVAEDEAMRRDVEQYETVDLRDGTTDRDVVEPARPVATNRF